jgi:hypothetical protein
MRIKKFHTFTESISGTELTNVGDYWGPGYGQQKLPITLSTSDTTIVRSEIDGEFYTQDDWWELYNEYISKGGRPLEGFTKLNLDLVLDFLKNN